MNIKVKRLIAFLIALMMVISLDVAMYASVINQEEKVQEQEDLQIPVEAEEAEEPELIEEPEPAEEPEPVDEPEEPIDEHEPVEEAELIDEPVEESEPVEELEGEDETVDKLVDEEELVMEEEMMEEVPMAATGSTNPQVKNYFEASGTSTNDHYSVVGVYIDLNDNVHLILDNDKNTANQTRFYNPMLNGFQAAGYGLNFTNYEPYWDEIGTTLTLTFPDSSTNTITGVRLFDFNLGPMTNRLQVTNTLQMLNQADGFSIRGMTFTLDLGHSITKKVNGIDVISSSPGEEVIYTVTVSNTGDFPLTGVNVYDDVPAGITIVGVSEDNVNWNPPTYTGGGDVILGTNLTLGVGVFEIYYIKATVNQNIEDGQEIINTAYTGGSVPREEDTARINVDIPYMDITIKKVITGNFGDMTRKFNFTVTVDKGDPIEPFTLGHNEEKSLTVHGEATLTLTEVDSGDYEVTVMVGENEIEAENGSYTIKLVDGIEIVVINHKDVVIDTGIDLDSLPYILILTLATIGLGVKVVGKQSINKKD